MVSEYCFRAFVATLICYLSDLVGSTETWKLFKTPGAASEPDRGYPRRRTGVSNESSDFQNPGTTDPETQNPKP